MLIGKGKRRETASRSWTSASPDEARDASGLHGWAGIENHMFKSDTLWVDDASEDIDTLLVFAGLFSAILTAFVVETYPMLQADSSAISNQLLALGVSSQLRATGQIIAPSTNATLASLIELPTFTPSAAIRWINVLFFLSLVLSLAAALFGILSKQWLREYIAWNSPLAEPRENVIVRQERFDDWETWNVAATISAIPALLELAMILFLVGVTVLLWTLDDIVAIVATVAVAAFLGAVSAFTILPVFLHRCPYRSPTAWAWLRLVDFTRCTIPRLIMQAAEPLLHKCALCMQRSPAYHKGWKTHIRHWLWKTHHAIESKAGRFATPKTWRDRDLGYHEVYPPWWRCDDVVEAAKKELECERLHIDADGNLIRHWGLSSIDDVHVHSTLRNVLETTTLLRALSWVHRASQDERVQGYIREALEMFHPASSPDTSDPMGPNLVADWYLLLAMRHGKLKHPLLPLHPSSSSSDDTSPLSSLRKGSGVFHRGNTVHLNLSRVNLIPEFPSHVHVHLPMLMRIISSDLAHCISLLQDACMSKASPFTNAPNQFIVLLVRRLSELFSVFKHLRGEHEMLKLMREPARERRADVLVASR